MSVALKLTVAIQSRGRYEATPPPAYTWGIRIPCLSVRNCQSLVQNT